MAFVVSQFFWFGQVFEFFFSIILLKQCFDQERSLLAMVPLAPIGALVFVVVSCIYECKINWTLDFRGGNLDISWTLKRVAPNDERF